MTRRWTAGVARWWTRVYTAPLPPRLRDERRAEVESDLWECLADPVAARQILPRLVLGAVDDVTWSLGHMEHTQRTSTWWTTGMVATISVAWLSIAYGPANGLVRESVWFFPTAATAHLLGMIAFLGPRLVIDLRLLGWTLGGAPIAGLAGRLMPWTIVGAAVTVVSGLTLWSGLGEGISGNPLFLIKMGAVVAALVNVGICHAVLLRRASDWDPASAPPLPARLSAALSIVLAIVMVIAGSLSRYVS